MKKILIIIVAIIFAFGVFYYLKNFQFNNGAQTKSLIKPKQEKTVYNFLLLGYGGGNHDGTYLTDTIMVANIDIKVKKVTLFSIPRDLWVRLPTKSGADFHTKINSVYEIGLFPNTYPDVDKTYLKESKTGLIKHTIRVIKNPSMAVINAIIWKIAEDEIILLTCKFLNPIAD